MKKIEKKSKKKSLFKSNHENDSTDSNNIKTFENQVLDFMNDVSSSLGITPFKVEFSSILNENGKIMFEPTPTLLVNSNQKDLNTIYHMIAHKMRHIYQLTNEKQFNLNSYKMLKDELSFSRANKEYDTKYSFQEIELDAEAFAQVYLKSNYNIDVRLESDDYQKIIEDYIIKNKAMF